jgi:hypothetical protein
MKMKQSVPKLWHTEFRRWGITQKKAYNDAIVFWPKYGCEDVDNAYLNRIKLHVSALKIDTPKKMYQSIMKRKCLGMMWSLEFMFILGGYSGSESCPERD